MNSDSQQKNQNLNEIIPDLEIEDFQLIQNPKAGTASRYPAPQPMISSLVEYLQESSEAARVPRYEDQS